MTMLEELIPWIWWGISGLGVILVISVLISLLLYRRMKRFESAYVSLQTFMAGNQMDILLDESNQKMHKLEQEIEKCKARLNPVELKLRASVDRAELLRFRAFENVGSDLSFACALISQEGNGIVLSSIHNREEARVYAKPIVGGHSVYSLSDEEKEVITKAMQGVKI
ncbi:DUF4446 family protein [Desulfosporosinus burensis]